MRLDENVTELVFEVAQEADGGFCAECLTENILTQGDSWDELRANVREAVAAFYFDPDPGLRKSGCTSSATKRLRWHEAPTRLEWSETGRLPMS